MAFYSSKIPRITFNAKNEKKEKYKKQRDKNKAT